MASERPEDGADGSGDSGEASAPPAGAPRRHSGYTPPWGLALPSPAAPPPPEVSDPRTLAEAGAQRRELLRDGTSAEPDVTFVAFSLGGEQYALPLEAVVKIERVPAIVQVPRTPSFVKGIASLRGEIVCVVDLRSVLDLPPATGDARGLLVLQDGARRVAVLSDVLPDYFRTKPSALLPAPIARGSEGIVTQVLEKADSTVAILDVNKLLSSLGRRLDA